MLGVILIFSIFKFNNGELRLYLFLGIFLGAIAYLILISKVINKILLTIILTIKNIICKILFLIKTPFIYIYKKVKTLLVKQKTQNS